MSEYISREAAIEAINGINWYKLNDDGRLTKGGTSHDKMFLPFTAVKETLKHLPAADVVEVVRCKDCMYCQKDELGRWCFNDYENELRDGDFCSHGKRKESKT